MILRFSLPFRTAWGQRLVVCGSAPSLGSWDPARALALQYSIDTGLWSQEISLPDDPPGPITYKYLLLDDHSGSQQPEWGPNRTVAPDGRQFARLVLEDYWRAPAEPENELFTAAFTQTL
ncbi:MAG: 4-alpha-glucanotransferase, partial [Hymenobacter sp.]|nr:4-alpha-glucanotransferase [Hymenobacter sp.]